MGLVNTVVGTLVIMLLGGVIYGVMAGCSIIFAANSVNGEPTLTLGIACLIPIILVFGYVIGTGIHDYRKINKKA